MATSNIHSITGTSSEAMEVSDEDSQLSNWMISGDKILELSDLKFEVGVNDEVQILHVKVKNFDDAQKILENFDHELFSYIFWIILSVDDLDSDEIPRLLKGLSTKILKIREMCLQICSKEMLFYHKPKSSNEFRKVYFFEKDSASKHIRNIKNALKLEFFLDVLRSLKVPLIELNFAQILEFLNLSENNDKLLLLKNAIRAKEEFIIKIFVLFMPHLEQEIIDDALNTKNMAIIMTMLRNFSPTDFTEEMVKGILSNKLKKEILMTITSSNDLRVLRILLINPQIFRSFCDFQMWREMREIASKKNFYKFLYELQQIEFVYYDEIFGGNDEIKNLHENIANGNLGEVEKFVEHFPDFKFCAVKNISALAMTLERKKFNIYVFLLSQNFFVYDAENIKEIIVNLSVSQKKLIREECFTMAVEKRDFLSTLLSKFNFVSSSKESNFSEALEMLKDLEKHNELKEIMKFSAQLDFKILCDLQTESVVSMDPTSDELIHRIAYYRKGTIYIGIASSKNQRYRNFIRELTHLVTYNVYGNNCLPYCKSDTKKEAEWTNIVTEMQKNYKMNPEDTDNIIKFKFECYDPVFLKKPLISAAYELLAYYHNDKDKIKELKARYPQLFSYSRSVIDDLKAPNILQVIKLNNDFGLLDDISEKGFQNKSPENAELLSSITSNDRKLIFLVSNLPQEAISKIYNELDFKAENKLHTRVKNLFVNPKIIEMKQIRKEFENLVKSGCVERIIVDGTKIPDEEIKFQVEFFEKCPNCVIVLDEKSMQTIKNSFDHKIVQHTITWNDLTERSRESFLYRYVKFQGNKIELRDLFPSEYVSRDVLAILSKNIDVVSINSPLQFDNQGELIPQQVQKKLKSFNQIDLKIHYEDFNIEEFTFTGANNEQVVLISDIAGSGKTTLLKKVYENLIIKFPRYWISYVSLKNHIASFLNADYGDDFQQFAVKILELDPLSESVFRQKFSEGEVKILFDGFDEILPNCKEKCLELFQNFLQHNKLNQIFVTTRTHLEEELESKLKASVYKIKSFSQKNMLDFIVYVWGKENPDLISELIEECALLLIDKIFKIHAMLPNLIGLPLIVKSFANAFKHEIKENFDRKIKDLSILDVVEKILEINSSLVTPSSTKSKPDVRIYQYYGVAFHFGFQSTAELGLSHDEDEWPKKEIKPFEILTFDDDGNFNFSHGIYSEYFIAKHAFNIIKNNKFISAAQLKIIEQIFTDEKYKITRLFLNDMLQGFESKNLNIFHSSDKFCASIEESSNEYFKFIVNEGLTNICIFILHLVQKNSDVSSLSVPEIITKILSNVLNEESFGEFLNEVLSNTKLFDSLLNDSISNKDNLLSVISSYGFLSSLELLFDKIVEKFGDEGLKKFLATRGVNGENLLFSACKNQHKEAIDLIWNKFEKNMDIKESVDELDRLDDNILHYAAKFAKSPETFDHIFNKIRNIFEDLGDLKKLLLHRGNFKAIPLLSTVEENEKIFMHILEKIYCEYFDSDLDKFIYEVNSDNENVIFLILMFGSTPTIESALDFLVKQKIDMKKLLQILNKNNQNILHLVLALNQSEEMLSFVFKFIKKHFSYAEIIKMLRENDDFRRNPYHYLAGVRASQFIKTVSTAYRKTMKDKEINEFFEKRKGTFKTLISIHFAEFIFKQFSENERGKIDTKIALKCFNNVQEILSKFQSVDDFNFLWPSIKENLMSCNNLEEFLLHKSSDGKNLLMRFAKKESEEIFFYLFKDVNCKNFEDLIKETDNNDRSLLDLITNEDMKENFLKECKMSKDEFKTLINASKLVSSDLLQEADEHPLKEVTKVGETSISSQLKPQTRAKTLKSDVSEVSIEKQSELVNKILSKCRVSSSTYELLLDQLKIIIKKICNSEEMILMAETVAAYESLIFDINCDVCTFNSPEYRSELQSYGEDLLYVPISCENEEEFVEKFTFELTRCAMQIVYDNNSLPYFEHQEEREKALMEILSIQVEMEPSSSEEQVVSNKTVELNELIPNFFTSQLIASDNLSRKHHQKISDYYSDFVKPDLEISDGNGIRDFNRKCCLLKRLKKSVLKLREDYNKIQLNELERKTFIKSNVPRLVLQRLYEQAKHSSCVDAQNLFVNVNLIDIDEIKDLYLEIALSESIKNIFVDATDWHDKERVDILMSRIHSNARMIVVGVDKTLWEDIKVVDLLFKWADFSKESQGRLLKKKIEYQGEDIEFEKVFISDYDDLSPETIQQLCSSQQLVINSPKFTNKYIPRRFQITHETGYGSFSCLENGSATSSSQSKGNFLYTENVSFEDLFDHVKSSQIILLADDELTGKTIALQQIQEHLIKTKGADSYVRYLPLNDNETINESDFLSFMMRKIPCRDEYSRFLKEYNNGEAIILIDGITNEVGNLYNVLKNFQNSRGSQLWLATTKQVGSEIQKNFTVKGTVTRINLILIKEEEEKRILGNFSNNSLLNVCKESLKFNENWSADVKQAVQSVFHYYALKIIKINTQPFGLTHDQGIVSKNVLEETKIIKFDGVDTDQTPNFASFCLIYYFVADFLKIQLKNFHTLLNQPASSRDALFDFLLKTLTNITSKVTRKMLSQMISTSVENIVKDSGDSLEALFISHYKLGEFYFYFDEHCIDLARFVIKILKCRGFSDDSSIALISKVLHPLATCSYKFSNSEFFCEVLKASDSVLERILNFTHLNSSNLTSESKKFSLFYLFAYHSIDESLIKTILSFFEDKSSLVNNNESCIFTIAIEMKNYKLLGFILDFISFEKWKDVLEIAFYSENFEIYDLVLKGKAKFINEREKVEVVTKKYHNILTEIKTLHNKIKGDNEEEDVITEIDDFMKEYPKLKLIKGEEPVDAIMFAGLNKRQKIFDFLLGKLLKLNKKIDKDSFKNYFYSKVALSNGSSDKMYFKALLLANCSLCSTLDHLKDIEKIKYVEEIEKMIDDLLGIEKVKDVLQAVGPTNVEINFTSELEKIVNKNYGLNGLKGVFLPSNKRIIINKLDDVQTRYGVFAHEVTHAAMFITYDNNCKPYLAIDKKCEDKFKKIVENLSEVFQNQIFLQEIESMRTNEPLNRYVIEADIIGVVLSDKFYENIREAEMIVRPPHIHAYYKDPEQMEVDENLIVNNQNQAQTAIESLKIQYRKSRDELFNFYSEITLKDLRIPNGIELKELNYKFGLWNKISLMPVEFKMPDSVKNKIFTEKILIFKETFPLLLLKSIFDVITNEVTDRTLFEVLTSNLFVDTQLLFEGNSEFLEECFNLFKSTTVTRIIFYRCKKSKEFNHSCWNKLSNKLKFLNKLQTKIILINHSSRLPSFENLFEVNGKIESDLITVEKNFILDLTVKYHGDKKKKLSDMNLNPADFSLETWNYLWTTNNIEVNYFKLQKSHFFEAKLLDKASLVNRGMDLNTFYNEIKEESKIILISDKMGSGKTEILQRLFKMCLEQSLEFWISFVRIKDYESSLRSLNFIDLDAGFHELLSIKSPLEKHVFKGEKIILFLDEIDLIDSDAQANLFKLLKNDKFHRTFLTCRLGHESELKEKLKICQTLGIAKFDLTEQHKYLQHTVGNSNKADLIHKWLRKIEFRKLIEFPYLVKLYCSYENSFGIKNFKYFDFCEFSYRSHYEVILGKEFLKYYELTHTFTALKEHVGNDVFGIKQNLQEGIKEDESISKNPIFSSFLIAKYVKKNLLNPQCWLYNKVFINFFMKILTSNEFRELRILLNELLENFTVPESLKIYTILFNDFLREQDINGTELIKKLNVELNEKGDSNLSLYITAVINSYQIRNQTTSEMLTAPSAPPFGSEIINS